jgi:hypothetical protein
MFHVIKVPGFEKKIKKLLSNLEHQELNKFIQNLKIGNIYGKPLSYKFFREKKIGNKSVISKIP